MVQSRSYPRSVPRPARWLVATLYVAVLTLLLVQSSASPLLGPAAPREFNLGWEILLIAGHLLGFGLLVIVCWWALGGTRGGRQAVLLALGFALALGLVTEGLQSLVPDRSVSLFDLAVNWGVSLLTARALWMRRRSG